MHHEEKAFFPISLPFYLYAITSLMAQTVKNLPAWRMEWLPTPVFLPGESHGQGSLAGYSPWGLKAGHDLATTQI